MQFDNELQKVAWENERPANNLDDWLFQENFDFHIELGLMISPVDFPAKFGF